MEPIEVVTRPALLAAGWEASEVRRRRGAELVPLRRGVYAPADDRLADPVLHHLARTQAAARVLSEQAVVSHVSAAVVHRLDLWRPDLSRVRVTRPRGHGGRVTADLHVTPSPLDDDEVTEVDGLHVTSVARTVVDLARTVSSERAVVVADCALRLGSVTPEALCQAVDRVRGWAGAPAARRVVAFADGRSESVGESRSRVAIARAGLPAPRPQLEVLDARHVLIGRCDFGWEELGTVGEFDGRVKYGRALTADRDPGEAVFAEKLREDALRDTGREVVRWVWAELGDFRPVASRIRRAYERAAIRRR